MKKTIPLRRILIEAQVTNENLGHQNQGFLSEQYGFLPSSPPLQSLSPTHNIWDEVASQLPELISNLTIRRIINKLPILDATENCLHDQYLCRAALLLCNIAHAYYWAEIGLNKTPPNSIMQPWMQVSQRLARPYPSLLSLDVLYNWKLKDPRRRDPLRAENIELLSPITGIQAECIEYKTALELMMQTIPIVSAVVRAHEAVVENDTSSLQQELFKILERIEHVKETTYSKIDLNPNSTNYVNPSMWGKVAGGGYFSGPISPNELGMSGAGYPIFSLMDIFIGRKVYTSKKGAEAIAVRHWYPKHLHNFFSALDDISIREFIMTHGDNALRNTFYQLIDAYAGESGFLGVHRLKTYGFMEVGFKTGRAVTNGGFKSLSVFKEKTWHTINEELEIARNERHIGLPTHSYFVNVKHTKTLATKSEKETKQISFDISETNIHYQPGDRCAILPENSDQLIKKTIHALQAEGTTSIKLHRPWQAALQLRSTYHDRTAIQSISLYQFLKAAKIRPVTRNIAKKLYEITAVAELGQILHDRAENQWELWDLFELLTTSGFNIQRLWRAQPWENEAICRIIPPETFRLYSIASAPTNSQNQSSQAELKLIVGRLSYETSDLKKTSSKKRAGTASNYLHHLSRQKSKNNPAISLRIVSAHRFRLPEDNRHPIVMFAAGTGIAPFISFIEQRTQQNAHKNWLFFSTRTRSQLHNEKWLSDMVACGALNLQVAFSRQDITTRHVFTSQNSEIIFERGKRRHLDELILEEKNARLLWTLLQSRQLGGKEAYFYICGKTGFATTVMSALKTVVSRFHGKSSGAINQFFYELNANRRLMMDIFTTYTTSTIEKHRTFSATEVAMHNNDNSGYWMLINGKVHDITEFIQMHPGGHQTLLLNCGVDASQSYKSVGHKSNLEIEAMLGMYEIGTVKRLNFGKAGGLAIGPNGLFTITLDEVFRVWVRYLYLIVEMENALKIDFDFLQQPTTQSESSHEFSMFKMQLFIHTQKRFYDHYLGVIIGEDLQVLWSVTSGLCDHNADIRWLQKRLKTTNDQCQIFKSIERLQDSLDRLKNFEFSLRNKRDNFLAEQKNICYQIVRENENFIKNYKLTICDGVKIFEQHESESIEKGALSLLECIKRIPIVLHNYYAQIGLHIPAQVEKKSNKDHVYQPP